jgi:hypothetical protein
MIAILSLQTILLLASAGAAWLSNAGHLWASVAMGIGLIELNLLFLVFVWSLILRKKLIALVVSLIVLKYAFLGYLIYKILQDPTVHQLGFVAGLSSLLFTLLMYVAGRAIKPKA